MTIQEKINNDELKYRKTLNMKGITVKEVSNNVVLSDILMPYINDYMDTDRRMRPSAVVYDDFCMREYWYLEKYPEFQEYYKHTYINDAWHKDELQKPMIFITGTMLHLILQHFFGREFYGTKIQVIDNKETINIYKDKEKPTEHNHFIIYKEPEIKFKISYKGKEFIFKGHVDGLMYDEHKHILVEFKTAGKTTLNKAPIFYNLKQIQLYMYLFNKQGIKIDKAYLLYTPLNFREILTQSREFIVDYNEEIGKELYNIFNVYVKTVVDDILPESYSMNKETCKLRGCPFIDKCFNNEK